MALIAALVVSAATAPIAASVARRLGVIDHPGPLKVHERAVPYLGGLAVLAGIAGPVVVGHPALLIPLALATALGLADDVAELAPRLRLVCELAIGVSVAAVIPARGIGGAFVTVAFAVVLLNAVNLLDGLDGLASAVGAVSALGFALVVDGDARVLALALGGALIGFLVWNRPPARIYLGDAGSYLVGAALAVLLALAGGAHRSVSVGIGALLLVAVPVADTTIAVLRRLRARQPLVQGDRGHVYDQLVDRGLRAPVATSVCVAAQVLLAIAGTAITRLSGPAAAAAVTGSVIIVGVPMLIAFTSPATWSPAPPTAPVVDVLGMAVRLSAPPSVAADLARLVGDLAPSTAPVRDVRLERGVDGRLRLLDDHEVVLSPVDDALAPATMVWRLGAIGAAASDHVVLHAGCVSAGPNAVVLPGASGAGKSLLCAACVEDGFDYLSDEQAALDLRSGMLTPFAKPLDLGDRGLVPASRLRAGSACGPRAPAAIVFPRYDADAPTTCTALDPPSTLLALCGNAVNLAATAGIGFRWLTGLALACPAWQVTYHETNEAVAAVRRAVRRPTPASPVSPASEVGPVTGSTTTVVLGDAVVVLDRATGAVHRLNASAGFVWLCAADVDDRDALVELAVAEAPAGTLVAGDVAATVDHLVDLGLLDLVGRDGRLVDP